MFADRRRIGVRFVPESADDLKIRRLVIDGRPWMFESHDCVNGLAHGRGLAVSIDGDGVAPEARCVLGKLVEGRVRPLRLADS